MTETLPILVIEDDLDTQANLRDVLELDGYEVDVVGSVAEALGPRDWSSLFAIILDRRLPDGTADDLLPEIRERAPRAAVIVVTGYADLEGAVSVIRHGVADFIPKPVNAGLLRASLQRVARVKHADERTRKAERLAAIGEMMASVAHESRNALQRIQVTVEMLQDKLKDDQEGMQSLERIESAADGIHRLLEDVREYAAPMHLEKTDCSLADAWRLAWAHLAQVRIHRDVQLTEVIADVNLRCFVDAERLEQVFRNILENSLAVLEKRGRIEISCTNAEIHGAEVVEIVMRDDGPGLTAEQKQHVFDAFFTTKRKGTGLGMAIVRRIVEAHDGTIRALDAHEAVRCFAFAFRWLRCHWRSLSRFATHG